LKQHRIADNKVADGDFADDTVAITLDDNLRSFRLKCSECVFVFVFRESGNKRRNDNRGGNSD
jgi:hypothetical protein